MLGSAPRSVVTIRRSRRTCARLHATAPKRVWLANGLLPRPQDRARKSQYQTRAEPQRDVFAFIESFYNQTRLHSATRYISPTEMELKAA